MAKNTTAYFVGPVLFAQVFERNRATPEQSEYVPEGGQYKISIGLTKEDAKLVKSWNKRYEGKTKEDFEESSKTGDAPEGIVDGLQYFTFRRDHIKTNKKGDVIHEWSGAPKVLNSEGEPWDTDVNIGNGSICTIKLDVYEGRNAKGQAYTIVRLEGVRVDEHVPYEPEGEPVEKETVDRSGGRPF